MEPARGWGGGVRSPSLPISPTPEDQTLGSSVMSLRPCTPSPGVKVELVASSPRPASGPLTFPETHPEVELPTQPCRALRPPWLAGHLEEGTLKTSIPLPPTAFYDT